jgi:hypothetical protein
MLAQSSTPCLLPTVKLSKFLMVGSFHSVRADQVLTSSPVRLGKSGLKVSKIILGTMQYGDPRWEKWVLGEDEAIKHIKAA